MTATGLTILISLLLVVLMMPRQWAALGIVASVIYLTSGQQLFIGGINFFAIRFIEIAGLIRIIIKKEISFVKINKIDKAFMAYQVVFLIIFLIRSAIDPSLIETRSNRIGNFCDGVMTYFIFRALLHDSAELKLFLKKFGILIVPFAIIMVIEGMTGKNIFYFMGGVPETPELREGYYRAQASFGVPIIAGSFGATMLPLFIYSALASDHRRWGIIGIISCLVIVIASHSSGPLLGMAAGFAAWLCWYFRKRMKAVRWAIVVFFILLQLAMNNPVWFIFDRISGVIGGDGWHRANLIDQYIHHFNDWWLMGMSLEKTGNWAATRLDNGAVDVTNVYVSLGISGGLITLILFIRLLIKCFKSLGESMRAVRKDINNGKDNDLLLWGIGSALLTHVVNISAVTYWDQMYVIWNMTLAIISSITAYYLSNKITVDEKKMEKAISNYSMRDHTFPKAL